MPTRLFPLVVLVALGCGRPSPEPSVVVTTSSGASSTYAPRSDLMVIKLLDGAPRSWPSNGFPPLRSARNPAATPDRDIAEDLRKQFNKNILDPAGLSAEQSQQVAGLMLKDFGTPAEPRVRVPDWNEIAKQGVRADWEAAKAAKDELKLDDASLARGSVVYRRWCMQCHGVTGAGNGAQAIELAAMPRDYRQGIFKFVTAFVKPDPKQPKKGLGPSGKPLRADLVRTIRKGIDGSMMPAFPTLTDAEVEDLVSYVIHLAVRGETEFATMAKAMQPTEEDPDFTGPELVWLFNQNLMFVLINWRRRRRARSRFRRRTFAPTTTVCSSAFRGYRELHLGGIRLCRLPRGLRPGAATEVGHVGWRRATAEPASRRLPRRPHREGLVRPALRRDLPQRYDGVPHRPRHRAVVLRQA
ncbi:MAG: cytochrome c [Gemmataceae bacterium]